MQSCKIRELCYNQTTMVGIRLDLLLLLLEGVVVAVPLMGGAVLLEGGAVLLEGASAGAAAAAHAAAAASGAAVASVWAAHQQESWLHPGQGKQDVQADAEVAAASGAAAASASHIETSAASAASSDHAPAAAAAAAASAAASAAHEPATVGPPPFGQHVQGEVVLVASASGAPSQRPGYCLQLHLQPVLQWLQVQTSLSFGFLALGEAMPNVHLEWLQVL